MTNKEKAIEFKDLIGLSPKNIYKICLDDENLNHSWFIFISFHNYSKFIEIEGDFDGSHIKIELLPPSIIEDKINLYKKTDVQTCWDVYNSNEEEVFNQTINNEIIKIDYSIDKDLYKINGTLYNGNKELFNRLIVYTKNNFISFVEGGKGVYVQKNKITRDDFEDTIETYSTNDNILRPIINLSEEVKMNYNAWTYFLKLPEKLFKND